MIERLDHLVLTVADIDATVDFYERVLGMRHEMGPLPDLWRQPL